MIVPAVIQQHADDAAFLGESRLALTRAPQVGLAQLQAFDGRLRASLDGLRVAGEHGRTLCERALERPSAGVVFAVAVGALESRDEVRLDRLLSVAQAVPDVAPGLDAAFGWVESRRLQGTVATLLRDSDGFKRRLAVAACATHRVDPGLATGSLLEDTDPSVRARSVRAAGELGLRELGRACISRLGDQDEDCQFWAAWSAVMLGDRGRSLEIVVDRGLSPGSHRERALRLSLQTMNTHEGHKVLQRLRGQGAASRELVQGSGINGDPVYGSWLVEQMGHMPVARLAGAAFSLITGVDLGQEALDRPAPTDVELGPTDDPEDSDVDMDPDEDLPWPDQPRVERWWKDNGSRFQAGTRYFVGKPVSHEHCMDVLREGDQPQRHLAAHYLCLMEPGAPLFNTSAPAWRQRQALATM